MRRTRETGQNEQREKRNRIREQCDLFLSSYIEGSQKAYTNFVKALHQESFWLEDQKVCSNTEDQDQQEQLEEQSNEPDTPRRVENVRFILDEEEDEELESIEEEDELESTENEDELESTEEEDELESDEHEFNKSKS
ncbi:hypothetical protein BD560DRAFT_429406 [Blakeslea trispora]|nr:hypothetical protein BD560DRAFT_429406 [Blakeslea trispora]